MADKKHLLIKNPQEGLVEFIGRQGGGGSEAEKEEKNYLPMAERFEQCYADFFSAQATRHGNRSLTVPNHFDIIELVFQSYFDQPGFEEYYINHFGLALIELSSFNKKGLFAISDHERFKYFSEQINKFIIEAKGIEVNQDYDGRIKFIKSFSFFSSSKMIRCIHDYNLIHFSIVHNDLIVSNLIESQKSSLISYLNESDIVFFDKNHIIELYDVNESIINTILDNFDILNDACSSSGTIIRPNNFNLPERTYGFNIVNADDTSLPIVGVIDTGVNRDTPLKPILISTGPEYDLTGTNQYVDEADHGTGVACLAALGKEPIPGFRGDFYASCKILPIKVLKSNSGSISPQSIGSIIRKAYEEYNVRIFTLTIGYSESPLETNQEYSNYAKILDNVTYDLDVLILICTTNNKDSNIIDCTYPDVFRDQSSNLAPPGESINNLVIGSVSDSFEERRNVFSIAPFRDAPASFSRKFHIDFEDTDVFNQSNRNYHLRKPDVLLPGGEYTEYDILGTGLESESSGIELLSADLGERTVRNIGTSLSVGIAANVASKLLKSYPNLDMQTVKALIINSSSIPNLGSLLDGFRDCLKKRIWGYGIVNEQILYFSDTNRVTLIMEDEIEIDHTKCYPVRLPEYLNNAERNQGLLNITATICFKVKPKNDNQLLYCPIHLSFAIGKNLVLNDNHIEEKINRTGNPYSRRVSNGINGNTNSNIKINPKANGWAQDFYYKSKILSNVQKIDFKVKREDIVSEDNCFKIAIGSSYHKLLALHNRNEYEMAHAYSLVITIEQFPIVNEALPSLYEEISLINELEPIVEPEIELIIS